jgi:COMPASS component SWD3
MTRRILTFVALFTLVLPATAQEPAAIAKHSRWVTSLAFNGDGSQLVTVGGESLQYRPGDVKLWDPKTGALVASLEGQPTNVWSVALSADGKTLLTSGYDGKVIAWNVAEKKPQQTLDKHKSWCRCVALAPDGKHFATAGEDGNIIVWETEGFKELKTVKAHEAAV